MTLGEHIAQIGAALIYTLTRCAITLVYWALDR